MKEYWMMWVWGIIEIAFGHSICGEQWGNKPKKILEKNVWRSGNGISNFLRLGWKDKESGEKKEKS